MARLWFSRSSNRDALDVLFLLYTRAADARAEGGLDAANRYPGCGDIQYPAVKDRAYPTLDAETKWSVVGSVYSDLVYAERGPCMMKARLWARRYASSTMGEESDRMTLPMDMKNLYHVSARPCGGGIDTDPKVAPEPAMYCPSVLMMPLGPAPYRKMLTVPKTKPMMAPTVPPMIAPILSLSKFEGPAWPPWALEGIGGIFARVR